MEEVDWRAAPLTKRLQVALMVLVGVQLQTRGLSLLHRYRASLALLPGGVGSRVRRGMVGPLAVSPLPVCTVPVGIYSWVFIPI